MDILCSPNNSTSIVAIAAVMVAGIALLIMMGYLSPEEVN